MPRAAKLKPLSQQTPIVRSLLERFRAVDKIGEDRKGVKPRADIVDERLCDDVIQYLAPTLEQYKGCTILDIHPGACLWSRKLHDFLKPTSHLLMEPEERYHEDFIRPLLQQPNSAYRHTALTGAHPVSYFENYKKILSDGELIPPRVPRSEDDPRRLDLDTSFLMTGNLARRYAFQAEAKRVSLAPMILQHMTWFALTNEIFHGAGRVRMLWWLPETYTTILNPPVPAYRSGYQVGLSMGASVHEVVVVNPFQPTKTPKKNHGHRSSLPSLLELNHGQVQQRMADADFRLPAGRQAYRRAGPIPDHVSEPKSPVLITHASVDAFEMALTELEDRWKHFDKTMNLGPKARKTSKAGIQHFVDSLEYPQCREDLSTGHWDMSGPQVQTKLSVGLDFHLRLINLEAHFCHFSEQGKDIGHLRTRLMQLGHSLLNHPSGMTAKPLFLQALLEDQQAFFADPQLLPNLRRPFEPLQAASDNFWPQTELVLLDVSPNGRDLSVPGIANTKECSKTCQNLLKYLFTYKAQPLPAVLDRIAPNAGRDLIPMAPAITDARKGGRLNADLVKVRMLNEEMMEQLLKAWFEWPFRPESWDLEMTVDGESDRIEEDRSQSSDLFMGS